MVGQERDQLHGAVISTLHTDQDEWRFLKTKEIQQKVAGPESFEGITPLRVLFKGGDCSCKRL